MVNHRANYSARATQIQHKQAQSMWTLGRPGQPVPSEPAGSSSRVDLLWKGGAGFGKINLESALGAGEGPGTKKLKQEIMVAALRMLSSLHPVAACHVIAALCNQMTNVLNSVNVGDGIGWADPAQNSVFCLRALDACVLILQKVCLFSSCRP